MRGNDRDNVRDRRTRWGCAIRNFWTLLYVEMNNLEKVKEKVNKLINKFGSAEIYIHQHSQTPLSFEEKCTLFDGLRLKGYNIHTKTNSHGVQYYRIS
jgi:hypothetical protein